MLNWTNWTACSVVSEEFEIFLRVVIFYFRTVLECINFVIIVIIIIKKYRVLCNTRLYFFSRWTEM